MIPTAESIAEKIDDRYFIENHYYLSETMPIEFAKRTAIEFAKLCCEEQARVIDEQANIDLYNYVKTGNLPDKDSILNAYPLDLIK